jgi:uncharacterized membrane protein YeaQ/YmgE (transglycosylase-associated protein family)
MNANSLVLTLVVGAVAGWLAGIIIRGGGFGAIGNIVVGIVGALLGDWIFGMLKISLGRGLVGSILTATIGAVILLAVVGRSRRG